MHRVREDATVLDIVAYCFFPDAEHVEHLMETRMTHGPSPEQAVDLIVGRKLGKRERKSVFATNGDRVIAWKK